MKLATVFFISCSTLMLAQERATTAAENVKIISDTFRMPQLGTARRIWIYLPKDYSTSRKKYPVFYMHDGQNLFDDKTSYSGEWQVDEAMNKIFSATATTAIVVGIDNGRERRVAELSPFPNRKYGGGDGDRYCDFIVSTLQPYINSHYRTKTGSQNTLIGGSSLGGLISVYAAVKYPKTFGRILAFSPAFWFNSKELNTYIQQSAVNLKHQRYYLIQGKLEDANMEQETRNIIHQLELKGAKPKNIYFRADEDGKHNELYWRREFPAAAVWFLK